MVKLFDRLEMSGSCKRRINTERTLGQLYHQHNSLKKKKDPQCETSQGWVDKAVELTEANFGGGAIETGRGSAQTKVVQHSGLNESCRSAAVVETDPAEAAVFEVC